MVTNALFTIAVCLAAPGDIVPTPGPEHKKLNEFEGQWDVEVTWGQMHLKGTSTYKSICDGLWLASEIRVADGEAKFEAHGYLGYDPSKKKYVGVWVNSMGGEIWRHEGGYDDTAKRLDMTGEVEGGPMGVRQTYKHTTEFKDKDHFTFKLYGVGPEDKEEFTATIVYARRK